MTAFTAIGDQVFWRGASLTDDQVEGLLEIFGLYGRESGNWALFDDLSAAMGEARLNRESAK
jgi:hypothetical protein